LRNSLSSRKILNHEGPKDAPIELFPNRQMGETTGGGTGLGGGDILERKDGAKGGGRNRLKGKTLEKWWAQVRKVQRTQREQKGRELGGM